MAAVRVVDRVVQLHVRERDVADNGVDALPTQLRVDERLRADVGVRVERVRDRRGRRVQLDADHRRCGRGQADEGTGAHAGFENSAAVEAEPFETRPDLANVRRVSEVRVDRRHRRGFVSPLAEQLFQYRALRRPVLLPQVEHLRHCTPRPVPRQHGLLRSRRRSVLGGECVSEANRLDVRRIACLRA